MRFQSENVNKSLFKSWKKIPIRKWKKNVFKNWKETPITKWKYFQM